MNKAKKKKNQLKHVVYNIFVCSWLQFQIMNNLKAECISVSVHTHCYNRISRKEKLEDLGNVDYSGIICCLFYTLSLSLPCLLLSNYIQMVLSFVFLAISFETRCQECMPSLFWLLFLICTANNAFFKM